MALPSTTLDSKMFYKRQETTPTPIPNTLRPNSEAYNQLAVNISSDAPSTIPKLLHLVRLPRTHNKAARRMAKDNRALTQLLTTPKGCSHFIERLSLSRWMKNLASGASKPSTETQSSVKDARRL